MCLFFILQKRRIFYVDVLGDVKLGDGVLVKLDEYFRGSYEELILGKSGFINDLKWIYWDEKIIEKFIFVSVNEVKVLDVFNIIIDINIDNEECIIVQLFVFENV